MREESITSNVVSGDSGGDPSCYGCIDPGTATEGFVQAVGVIEDPLVTFGFPVAMVSGGAALTIATFPEGLPATIPMDIGLAGGAIACAVSGWTLMKHNVVWGPVTNVAEGGAGKVRDGASWAWDNTLGRL